MTVTKFEIIFTLCRCGAASSWARKATGIILLNYRLFEEKLKPTENAFNF